MTTNLHGDIIGLLQGLRFEPLSQGLGKEVRRREAWLQEQAG